MAFVQVQCPDCHSTDVVEYGKQANGTQRGSVSKVEMTPLHCPSKGISVDKQANDDVVHLCCFRKAPIRRLLSRGNTSPFHNF